MSYPAARVSDMHLCPMVTGLVPHVGGPILPPGVPTILIAGLPAANVATMCSCVGPPDLIVKGSAGCLFAGKPAARVTDSCAHGGMITVGCPTVLIGDTGVGSGAAGGSGGNAAAGTARQIATLMAAHEQGLPFVKRDCDGGGGFEASLGSEPAKTYIEIELTDPAGLPGAGLRYLIEAPGGETREGYLDANGRAKEAGLAPGDCSVSFPDLDRTAWHP